MHGGLSAGARTETGRKRLVEVKTVHGRETREERAARSKILTELRTIDDAAHAFGWMSSTRKPGRKPQ